MTAESQEKFDLLVRKYAVNFGVMPPLPALTMGVSSEEFNARMERALERGRPLRGWWDDGTEEGDADDRVPEGEEDFHVPVSESEIEYLKDNLKKLERKQMNAWQRVKAWLGE